VNPETPGKGHKRFWLGWLLAGVIPLFVVVLLLMGLIERDRADHAEIQKRMAAIRAAGQPVTAEDCAKRYPYPPPEKDASVLLKPALDLLAVPQDETTNVLFWDLALPRSAPLDESAITEGGKWLDRNRAAFDLIPWSKLDGTWVGFDFSIGQTNKAQASLSKMGRLGRFLCLRAVLQAEEQEPHEAIQSLQLAALIANTLKCDVPIHFRLKSAMEGDIFRSLERVVNRANLSDSDLASFPVFITFTNIGATKQSVLINLRPDAFWAADLLQSNSTQLIKGVTSPVRKLFRFYEGELLYHDADLLHYLNWNDKCLAVLKLPMSNAIPILRNMEAQREMAAKNRRLVILDAFRRERFSFLSMNEPDITAFLLPELKAVAHARLSVAAVAVERWRLAHNGQAPGSLAEIAPNYLSVIPADPFDGRPLRYKKLPTGCVIYSIGEDLTDDGGKEEEPNTNGHPHYDITFTMDR
jgi:hypothetical protein